jgi:hypothetical protein
LSRFYCLRAFEDAPPMVQGLWNIGSPGETLGASTLEGHARLTKLCCLLVRLVASSALRESDPLVAEFQETPGGCAQRRLQTQTTRGKNV